MWFFYTAFLLLVGSVAPLSRFFASAGLRVPLSRKYGKILSCSAGIHRSALQFS